MVQCTYPLWNAAPKGTSLHWISTWCKYRAVELQPANWRAWTAALRPENRTMAHRMACDPLQIRRECGGRAWPSVLTSPRLILFHGAPSHSTLSRLVRRFRKPRRVPPCTPPPALTASFEPPTSERRVSRTLRHARKEKHETMVVTCTSAESPAQKTMPPAMPDGQEHLMKPCSVSDSIQ